MNGNFFRIVTENISLKHIAIHLKVSVNASGRKFKKNSIPVREKGFLVKKQILIKKQR